jgi:hypothetical protein
MIQNLHDLAECFTTAVTFEKVFPDSRQPSQCIRGSRGAVLYDTRNGRFTWRRFDSSRKYLNFDPNESRQLNAAAHACGLTFRPREQRQRVNTSSLSALTPAY